MLPLVSITSASATGETIDARVTFACGAIVPSRT